MCWTAESLGFKTEFGLTIEELGIILFYNVFWLHHSTRAPQYKHIRYSFLAATAACPRRLAGWRIRHTNIEMLERMRSSFPATRNCCFPSERGRERERGKEREKENGKTSVCIVFYVCAMFQHQLKLNTGYFVFSTCLNIGRRRMLLSSFRRSSLIRFCHFCVVAVVFVVVFTRIVFSVEFFGVSCFRLPPENQFLLRVLYLSVEDFTHTYTEFVVCVCVRNGYELRVTQSMWSSGKR